MQLIYLVAWRLPAHTGGAYNTDRVGVSEKVIKMCGRFVQVGKILTDLQILRCHLHQNVFGSWALCSPGP